MPRRSFSPSPGAVLSITPKAASKAPAKPHLLTHSLFWIALHMMSSSCLVTRTAPPAVCSAHPLQMILNKLAVSKDTANKAPTLPVFTVMSLQTAFSVAFVMRDHGAVTRRIALQWLPVRHFVLPAFRLLPDASCRLHFFLSPCSALGTIVFPLHVRSLLMCCFLPLSICQLPRSFNEVCIRFFSRSVSQSHRSFCRRLRVLRAGACVCLRNATALAHHELASAGTRNQYGAARWPSCHAPGASL
jgi:hypothetical protein